MDPRQLETFSVVAREHSFTRAAGVLHLSQSAVSQQIAALERELQVQLFDRSRRRVALTPAGVALLDWSTRLLAENQAARRAVVAAQGHVTGTLEIAASLTIAAYLLPHPLVGLVRQNPDVRPIVRVENTQQVIGSVLGGRADLGFIEGHADAEGIDLERLREDELVVIAPAGHRFAQTEEIEFGDLVTEPFVAREQGSGTRQIAEVELARAGFASSQLRTIAEVTGIEAIKASVEAGLGVAIVSALSIRRELQLQTLIARPIRGVSLHRELMAVLAAGQPVLPAARELVRLARDHRTDWHPISA